MDMKCRILEMLHRKNLEILPGVQIICLWKVKKGGPGSQWAIGKNRIEAIVRYP